MADSNYAELNPEDKFLDATYGPYPVYVESYGRPDSQSSYGEISEDDSFVATESNPKTNKSKYGFEWKNIKTHLLSAFLVIVIFYCFMKKRM